MDILCDKIREIKDNLGMEYNDIPTSFFFKDKTNFNISIFSCIDLMRNSCNENDINNNVGQLVMIYYYVLDKLVEQGIYPDSIIELMIFDDFQKIWKDGTLHYDYGKMINPPDYVSISSDIDKEILLMKEGTYKKGKLDIDEYYNKILKYFELIKKDHSDKPKCLSNKSVKNYTNDINIYLTRYLNSDYVEEETEELIHILHRTMYSFVEMGVNPSKYITDLVDKIRNDSLNKSK